MNSNSMELNIQRFAEGGSDGTSSSGNAAVAQPQNTGENAVNTADNTSVAGENNGSQQEIDFSSYSEEQIEELIDNNPAFDKVIGKRMKNSFGKRLAQERAKMQEAMRPANNVIDKLMVRHGVDSMEELSKIIDTSTKEEFAIQNGVSEDLADEMLQLRVNNRRNAMMREQYEAEMKVQQQLSIWQDEAAKVKETYPDFDLEKELGNNDFKRLISADERYRMPMKQIYEMIHHDEIVEAAKKDTAAAYAKSTAQMQARPSENGLGNQVAVNGSMDVSKLTKKERAELAKRAQRGETITF